MGEKGVQGAACELDEFQLEMRSKFAGLRFICRAKVVVSTTLQFSLWLKHSHSTNV